MDKTTFKFDNSSVRRQDRLIEPEAATDIIKNGEFGVLSMVEVLGEASYGGYGIPINYVWDGGVYIYLHSAPSGHKLDSINKNPNVSFTIIGRTNVISHKFTTAYESVVIRGKIVRGLTNQEKMDALLLLLDKYSPNDKENGIKYTNASFNRTEILRIEIDTVSGKAKRVLP